MTDHDARGDDDIGTVLAAAGDRWQIGRPLGMWSALRRSADGRHERYLVGTSATALADKIIRAEAGDS